MSLASPFLVLALLSHPMGGEENWKKVPYPTMAGVMPSPPAFRNLI